MPIPIIDIFAGPGGLGEGFSTMTNADGSPSFRIALSVEKDPVACRTLRTRSVRRHLARAGSIQCYFQFLRGEITRSEFESLAAVRAAMADADNEVLEAELGKCPPEMLDERVRRALEGADEWALIGGPPCQAYSLAGRARRANDKAFESDVKHFLYREYLRFIKVHAPPVFVMENVKGLLSSHHGGVPIFARIINDLARPAPGLTYDIRSFVKRDDLVGLKADDYVIESERYGVPQARHRVILFGVRSDWAGRRSRLLSPVEQMVKVGQVLGGMPKLRSGLSRGADSLVEWRRAIRNASSSVRGWGAKGERRLISVMKGASRASVELQHQGAGFLPIKHSFPAQAPPEILRWLQVPGLGGVIQHESRQHMASDLARYQFAAAYAQEFHYSPKLDQFPVALLPSHKNALDPEDRQTQFPDRFRVQCADGPSSTIVSHIAKDGHYYIHFDPAQCRSLTVREAARLQTFPEDYYFEGNRTQQYGQVGNAVPPLLAFKIADIVADLIQGGRPATRSKSDLERERATT
jgi:DNA (cytosine-5)-methyltransferase 1